MKWCKFVKTLVLDNETKYCTFNSSSKAETIIHDSEIDDVFESIYSTIISSKQKSLAKSSVCIIDYCRSSYQYFEV